MLYLNSSVCSAVSHDIQRALSAADGYLYLGLPDEALRELEELAPEDQSESVVMRAQIRALLHLRAWDRARELSEFGTAIYPEENEFVVQRAFALQQQKRATDAVRALMSAPDWIRRTGILHYNLGCYQAQLGDLSLARQCIDEACEMNSAFDKNARHDPDLARLWD